MRTVATRPVADRPGRASVATGARPGVGLTTLRCLSNGFLISGLLWAAALARVLDGRLRSAAGYLLVAAVFALVGIIHSPLPDERIALPWHVLAQFGEGPLASFAAAVRYQTPYHWAAAYVLLALGLFGLSLLPDEEPFHETTV